MRVCDEVEVLNQSPQGFLSCFSFVLMFLHEDDQALVSVSRMKTNENDESDHKVELWFTATEIQYKIYSCMTACNLNFWSAVSCLTLQFASASMRRGVSQERRRIRRTRRSECFLVHSFVRSFIRSRWLAFADFHHLRISLRSANIKQRARCISCKNKKIQRIRLSLQHQRERLQPRKFVTESSSTTPFVIVLFPLADRHLYVSRGESGASEKGNEKKFLNLCPPQEHVNNNRTQKRNNSKQIINSAWRITSTQTVQVSRCKNSYFTTWKVATIRSNQFVKKINETTQDKWRPSSGWTINSQSIRIGHLSRSRCQRGAQQINFRTTKRDTNNLRRGLVLTSFIQKTTTIITNRIIMGLFRRQMQSTGLCRMDNCNNSERSSRKFLRTNEAPYQTIGQRTLAATLGYKELSIRHFWLSVLSESISCYLYVFIVCSTRISWTGSIIGHEPNLLAMALASGVTMTLLILTFRTVHVNPALTVAFLLTGRIPLIRAIIYILFHCMSSIAAIALLYSISVTGHAGALGLDNPHPSLEAWQTMIVEFVISFVVTLATYTTCSYSSYSSARQYILEQVGLNSSDLLDLKSNACDKDNLATIEVNGVNKHQHQNNIGGLLGSTTMHQQSQHHRPVKTALASSLATAPRRQLTSSNFRVHPSSKGYISSDTYENSDYEYDYDNHRIYSAQQQSSPELSPSSRVQPIEELMHEESQLLAPNGFTFHMTPCQSFIIGSAYAITSLTGVSVSTKSTPSQVLLLSSTRAQGWISRSFQVWKLD